jgi:hypothetical protein
MIKKCCTFNLLGGCYYGMFFSPVGFTAIAVNRLTQKIQTTIDSQGLDQFSGLWKAKC